MLGLGFDAGGLEAHTTDIEQDRWNRFPEGHKAARKGPVVSSYWNDLKHSASTATC